MVDSLAEDEKEPAHGHILEAIVTRSGEVTLLAWTGRSSKCNSCLPSSPVVYSQNPFVPPGLSQAELENRTNALRPAFPRTDAVVIYERLTRLQPVRFAHFRLHLPCIVFGITRLRKAEENVYLAETTGLGDVEFTTVDALPIGEPRRLVFVDTRIHGFHGSDGVATWEDGSEVDSNSDLGNGNADMDAELVRVPIIEEAPPAPPDLYTRALQLIARLEQPFIALLLLQQSDGSYKRVATDQEIVVDGTGERFPMDVRVEVLEIL